MTKTLMQMGGRLKKKAEGESVPPSDSNLWKKRGREKQLRRGSDDVSKGENRSGEEMIGLISGSNSKNKTEAKEGDHFK